MELGAFSSRQPRAKASSALAATCHCGAVRVEIPQRPEKLTNCNCSICRRYGALWAYYKVGTVKIVGHPEHTTGYVQGDKTLRTVWCKHCGCVTHWEPLDPKAEGHMAVNARNFDPAALGPVVIRHFDGADTWKFVD